MIFYFSGTGNSKYVAQRIADALGDTLLSMNDRIKTHDISAVEIGERLVVVTPPTLGAFRASCGNGC